MYKGRNTLRPLEVYDVTLPTPLPVGDKIRGLRSPKGYQDSGGNGRPPSLSMTKLIIVTSHSQTYHVLVDNWRNAVHIIGMTATNFDTH